MKKAAHIIVFLGLNLGFMLYARALTNAEKDRWMDGVTVSEWADVLWLPILILAVGNLAIYLVFCRSKS